MNGSFIYSSSWRQEELQETGGASVQCCSGWHPLSIPVSRFTLMWVATPQGGIFSCP